MPDKTTLITSNTADVFLEVLSIAKNHGLDVTNDTFLRTGNFGYITELSAKIIQNSVLSKQIDFNELFASTAINPLSIINLCRSFNIDVAQATPSYGDLELTINLNDAQNQMYTNIRSDRSLIERYGEEIATFPVNSAIIIDRGTKFLVGSTNFYLEKSIAVWRDELTGRWVAKYLLTEQQRTRFQSLNSSYLNTKLRIMNNTNYLTIFPRVYQFEVQELQKLIHKSEIVYTSVINFSYTDNYIGARLFYSLNNNSTKKEEIILDNSIVSKNPHVEAFGGRLAVTFPNDLDTFRPSANSVLSLETYVSKGSRGNLRFTKPLSIIQNEKATHRYQLIAYIRNGLTYGGSDEPSVNQLRNQFINQVSTRNVITTASDLNLYFSRLKDLVRTISNSDVLFIKKRDDILKRYYDAFILFRDNKNFTVSASDNGGVLRSDSYNNDISGNYLSSVIPTYTFKEVRFNESFSGKEIKYGQIILPPNNNDDVAVFYSGEREDLLTDDYYITPFYIHATTTPINSVHYIFNRTNQASPLDIEVAYGSDRWLYPTEAILKRTGLDDDFYTITFYFETSRSVLASDRYKYNLSLYQRGNSLLETIVDAEPVIRNESYSSEDGEDEIVYTELVFKIFVNKDEEFTFGDSIALNLSFDKTDDKKQVFSDLRFKLDIEDLNGKPEISVTSDYLSLFVDLQNIMYSDMKVVKSLTGNLIDYIDIMDVPAIHSSYLNSANPKDRGDMSYFISQMFTFVDLLKESQQNIDQSEMINIKFYRTYGVSELYNTVKTDMDLRLDVMTKLTEPSEAKALIDAIRIFVDNYNVSGIFRYSDLISDIYNSKLGTHIYDITFRGLNGTWEQSIESISDVDVYYPEYFNIPKENLKNIRVFNYNPITKEKKELIKD